MRPEGDPDADGLTPEQFRWLVGVSLAVGLLVLLLVLGLTAASHVYGVGGGQQGPPDAGVDVRTQATADGVAANLTYRGREAANPDHLLVTVGDDPVGNWSELGGEAPRGFVGTGHTLLLRAVDPGDVVEVHWTGGDERVRLALATVATEAEP